MTNTIAMNDRYFLAHNSETTAPIRFKFSNELYSRNDIDMNKIFRRAQYMVGFLRLGHIFSKGFVVLTTYKCSYKFVY